MHWRAAARLFEELLMLPVAVPGLATELALILTYGHIRGFRLSFAFIWVGHMVFTLPFMGVGNSEALYRTPAHPFVATFLAGSTGSVATLRRVGAMR